MKISLSLLIFTHTKYIYLKTRINFLSNHGTHKNENKRFWKKNYQTLLWQLKFKERKEVQGHEVLATKIFIIKSLHSVL